MVTGSRIGNALFTKTQQRDLALLYGQAEKSYYPNEIVRKANIGRGAVSRELQKVEQCRYINSEPPRQPKPLPGK